MNNSSLAKLTMIYAVGNIGSKVLSYLMVIIYSYYIIPDDMGYYDLIITTVAMIQPLVIFQMNDGVYRFLMEGTDIDKNSVLSTGFCFISISFFLSLVLFVILNLFFKIDSSLYLLLFFLSTVVFVFFQDAVRGYNCSRLYAEAGVLNSLIMLLLEVIGLVILNYGVLALVVSKTIANFLSVLYLFSRNGNLRNISINFFDWSLLKKLAFYSAPLVPNTISWWLVNFSNRYIIVYFLGTASNGIFSMSNKFPTVLATITSIFYLAWQETALNKYNTKERDAYFSEIFQKYYCLLFCLTLCAIPATQIVCDFYLAEQYKSAWFYTGFLFLGASFSALCAYLGLGYQISKETIRSFYTTSLAAIANVVLNLFLIKLIGLHAASLSTFISYFFLFIIRIKHVRRYFSLTVNWSEFYRLVALCLLFLTVTLYFKNVIVSSLLLLFGVSMLMFKNSFMIHKFLSYFTK